MHQDEPNPPGARRRQHKRQPIAPAVNEVVTTDPLPIQTVEVSCGPKGVTTDSGDHDDSRPLHEALAGLEARLLKERYRIGSEIGRGGMGVVASPAGSTIRASWPCMSSGCLGMASHSL